MHSGDNDAVIAHPEVDCVIVSTSEHEHTVAAPTGTPPALVERINVAVIEAGQLPDVRERLLTQAFEPLADTPSAFDQLIRAEISKWARVAKESDARAQ